MDSEKKKETRQLKGKIKYTASVFKDAERDYAVNFVGKELYESIGRGKPFGMELILKEDGKSAFKLAKEEIEKEFGQGKLYKDKIIEILDNAFPDFKDEMIFFDVDTQKDFMNVDGALYVSNAESIKTNLAKLSEFALDNKVTVLASMDTHYGDEEHKKIETELKKWGGPFPDHCMSGSEGQTSIDETKGESNIVIIEKQTYDAFSNPKTKIFLKEVGEAIVYGVATDYCVKAAVLGMLKMGIKVTVVEDAIMGVAKETTDAALKEMKEKGAVFKTTDEVLKGEKNS